MAQDRRKSRFVLSDLTFKDEPLGRIAQSGLTGTTLGQGIILISPREFLTFLFFDSYTSFNSGKTGRREGFAHGTAEKWRISFNRRRLGIVNGVVLSLSHTTLEG